jgi:hypothetical protein
MVLHGLFSLLFDGVPMGLDIHWRQSFIKPQPIYILIFGVENQMQRIEDDDWNSIVKERLALADRGIKSYLFIKKNGGLLC